MTLPLLAAQISAWPVRTGLPPAYTAALKFYRKHGFQDGAPFADYTENGFSQYMHLEL